MNHAIVELAQTYMVCGIAIASLTYFWFKYKTAYNARKLMKKRKLF